MQNIQSSMVNMGGGGGVLSSFKIIARIATNCDIHSTMTQYRLEHLRSPMCHRNSVCSLIQVTEVQMAETTGGL